MVAFIIVIFRILGFQSPVIFEIPIKWKQIKEEFSCYPIKIAVNIILGFCLLPFIHYDPAYNLSARVILEFVGLVVLMDTWFFWIHLLMHKSKFLYKWAHHQHHKSIVMSGLSSLSLSMLEDIILLGGWLGLFVAFDSLFGLSFIGCIAALTFMFICNAAAHINLELNIMTNNPDLIDKTHISRSLITSCTAHALHHARFNENYGFYFTCWDRLMGTLSKDYDAVYRRVLKRQPMTNIHERIIEDGNPDQP
ncbi:MAG: sterol desaturase family protein [Alphaproteobacteria bacterium]|nr:sterol desaturase family protein [Alphaproteobacteria bacterium]